MLMRSKPLPHSDLCPSWAANIPSTKAEVRDSHVSGRRLADGTMLYGCTCNLSVDLTACDQDFDVSFTAVRR